VLGADLEERRHRVGLREHHGVVEERLAGEQRQADDRPARIRREDRAGDLAEADRPPLADPDRRVRVGLGQFLVVDRRKHIALDRADDLLCLLIATVDHQPAWALGHAGADEHDAEAKQRADPEAQPPTHIYREQGLVEQDQRDRTGEYRAQPEGAVSPPPGAPA
jgi:hypothetical protein